MPITPTKKKKNGLTQYLVRINYTDQAGEYRQIQRTVYGKAEAVEMERKLLASVQETPETKLTVSDLYKLFIDSKANNIRDQTLKQYISNLSVHFLPQFGSYKLKALTIPLADDWRNSLLGKPIKKSTANAVYSSVKSLFRFAVKRGYIKSSPFDMVDSIKMEKKHKMDNIHYYTVDQFRRFIAIAQNEMIASGKYQDRAVYVFFNIAFYTGMRKGEINGLKWKDMEGNILHVRRQAYDAPLKTGASYRDLQIPKPLLEVLSEQQHFQMEDRRYSDDYYIVGAISPIDINLFGRRLTKYAVMAELPRIRVHDFRHSHASLLANEGINIQEISRRLGHSNVLMTWNIYSHLYPREEERAVNILNNIR